MKVCELCNSSATIYCESDQASLCCDCDAKVHSANFLVAKHSRTLLCHVCQSLTPWNGSGPKLGTTISVCQRCVNRSRTVNGTPENHEDEDGEDDEHGEEDDDDDDDDNDEENQVVPWSSTPPPQISCSSASEEESSGSLSNGDEGPSDSKPAPSLKRMHQQSSSRLTSHRVCVFLLSLSLRISQIASNLNQFHLFFHFAERSRAI